MRTIRTAVLIKPAGMVSEERFNAINDMITRTCDRNGLTIKWAEGVMLDRAEAEEFYAGHKGKWFYEPMAAQITGQWLCAYVIEGKFAARIMRRLIGDTDPAVAKVKSPGSIRGLFTEGNMSELAKSKQVVDNCIHGSKNALEAKREIAVLMKAAASTLER